MMEGMVIAKSPKNCDANELKKFEELVIEGGEVNPVGLSDRILNAELLLFIYAKEQCVGIGAIKRPITEYKLDLFEKAGFLQQKKYDYELGWVYVNEEMRGLHLGNKLMESICHYMTESLSGKGCFATVRQNNDRMQHLFVKYGFSKVGHSYKSRRGDYFLELYTKV
ncbi:TPA: GNAT family N-acetyltransferase [Escherichia coli]